MFNATIIGRLGADARVIDNGSGRPFLTMRIASSSSYRDGGGAPHERTMWIDVNLSADHPCKPYLTKGTLVYVHGRVVLRCYSSPKEKQFVPSATVFCSELQLLSSPSKSDSNTSDHAKQAF